MTENVRGQEGLVAEDLRIQRELMEEVELISIQGEKLGTVEFKQESYNEGAEVFPVKVTPDLNWAEEVLPAVEIDRALDDYFAENPELPGLWLETSLNNWPAVKLYNKLGFVPVSSVDEETMQFMMVKYNHVHRQNRPAR